MKPSSNVGEMGSINEDGDDTNIHTNSTRESSMHALHLFSLLSRIRSHLIYATNSFSSPSVPLHPDVSLLPPSRAPRVLHDDVVLILGRPIPNGRHPMIQISPTRPIKNTLQPSITDQIYIYELICSLNLYIYYGL